MKRKTTSTVDAERLVDDAHELLSATAHVAEEKVMAARNRLAAAIRNGREMLEDVRDQAVEKAEAADELVRENPYKAIGLALVVGGLVGLYLARRR